MFKNSYGNGQTKLILSQQVVRVNHYAPQPLISCISEYFKAECSESHCFTFLRPYFIVQTILCTVLKISTRFKLQTSGPKSGKMDSNSNKCYVPWLIGNMRCCNNAGIIDPTELQNIFAIQI